MATDRYGNPIDIHQRAIDPISYEDYVGGENESEGYEGGTDIGGGLSAAVGIGASGLKMGGVDLGPLGYGVGAIQDAAEGKSAEDVGLGVVKDVAKDVGGALAGPIGRGVVGIATAKDPATAAKSFGGSVVGGVLGGVVAGPVGSFVGSKLGSLAASNFDSISDAVRNPAEAWGDLSNNRIGETERDILEDAGYSYGESKAAYERTQGLIDQGIADSLGDAVHERTQGLIDQGIADSLGDAAAGGDIGDAGDAQGSSGSGAGMGPGL